MILSENSVAFLHALKVKFSCVSKKTFSGLQVRRVVGSSKNEMCQVTSRKFVMVFAVLLMLLTLSASLLYVSCFHKTHSLKEKLKIASYVYNESYSYNNEVARTMTVLSSKEMENIRIQLNIRQRELERYCQIIGRTNVNLDNVFSNMIIDVKHGVAWCPIYKVASSTWMKHFATLGGALTDTAMNLIRKNVLQINSIVRQAFPRDPDTNKTLQKLNRTKKFLIVRHPLERLVSAYRDKLENMNGREYYYKRFGRHITHKYHRYRNSSETKLEPTFAEFLRFIVDEKYFDEHWAPFVDTCEPCAIRYDYILKFDTLKRDQHFLIQELGLTEYLYRRNDLKNINPRGETTSAVVKEYMQNVPNELINSVINIYEQDFKLFSYLPV